MKKRKNIIVILSILLVISIGNFFRISTAAVNISTVDFLSVFAIGALAGLLIGLIASSKKSE